MAPPTGIEKKDKKKKNKNNNKEENKKNRNKEEKKNKKDKKIDRNSEVVKSEPVNPCKKNKKRKLESSLDVNQENNSEINNKGTKQKKNKDEKKLKTNQEEYEDQDETITDTRFSSSLHDPRFRKMKKKDLKIEIDSRFSKKLENKDFAGSSAPIDKRGKVIKEEKGKGLMRHYYVKNDNERIDEERERDEEEEREDDVMSDVSSDTDDESSDTDEYEEDDDQNLGNNEIANYAMARHNDTPIIEKETHRLAVVNMDWDHIKAVDIFMVMTSCLPTGGKIESVKVYPTEFGIKCMDIESTKGPAALLDLKPDENNNNEINNNNYNNDNNSDSDEDFSDNGESESDSDDNNDEGDINDDFDEDDDEFSDEISDNDDISDDNDDEVNEKLRAYELKKLGYYNGVVVCDSSATANHLYNELDGTELLDTSNVFDLRFIPDSVQFNHPPRDIATEAPVNYKAPDFETRALQHSKVKLTWEDENPERKKVLRRNFDPEQLDELNIYLASSDSSDSEEDKKSKREAAREKFLSLLKPGNEIPDSEIPDFENPDSDNSDDEEGKGDMEMTFNPGLEALSKKISDKKMGKNEETVWESVLRKKREKKHAKKMQKFNNNNNIINSDSDSDNSNDDINEDDDFFMEEREKKSKGKGKREKEKNKEERESLEREREASRAELELLLANDENAKSEKKGYNMKKTKGKGKKGKKKDKDANNEEKIPEVNVSEDPRFNKMFNSHLFALDPTDPQYKRSAAYLRNKSKKGEKSEKREATQDEATEDLDERENDSKNKQKYETSAAIRNIKKNIKPHQSGKGW